MIAPAAVHVAIFAAVRVPLSRCELSISVDSTTTWPCKQPQGDDAGAAAGPLQRRVLVIEDNEDAADTLQEVLELDGHEVAVAYSGPEGLAKAREFRPDLVLCDIGLPGMDGYTVARLFRADNELKHAHLVAVSGYALPEDLQRAAEAGFERHIAKPPTLEKIEKVVREVR